MKKKILVTSALPYANGPIHFGHIAGAYLPADAFVRFEKLKKSDIIYICGSDEYGVAITYSAELAKRSYKDHVDYFHNINLNFFKDMDINFDHYSRTTSKFHIKIVQQFFLDLFENGYIEERVEEHLFSENENKFLADRYVVGTCPKCGFEEARGDECQRCAASYEAKDLKNPRSKLSNSKLTLKLSKHWYMKFDMFKEKLNVWIKDKDWKDNVLNFSLSYIKNLKERCITRDSTWGIPVPLKGAEDKVLYVWFDAPIGYISATVEWADKINQKDKWKDYWFDQKTKLVNFVGKDNIPFHSVFFPAMIMGQNVPYKLVDDLPANEFLLLEGRQFSKSDNWYIDLSSFFKKFSSDQIRFYLAYIAPETHDSDFSWKDFQNVCNSELVNKFGNFIYRTLSFIQNFLDKKIPKISEMQEIDKKFLSEINELILKIDEAYTTYKLKKASNLIMELATLGNIYFDHKKPWALRKESSKLNELSTTINLCIKCIYALAFTAYPIIPKAAQKIYNMIGFENLISDQNFKNLNITEDKILDEPKVLFQKIEDNMIEDEINKLNKKEENLKSFEKLKEEITYEDFSKLDLRVGKIISAEKVEKSNKLLKITVDIGFEKRQIVSSIAKTFKPEDLIGKKVIIVANLKTAKLMGIDSQGMILAAGNDAANLELPFITIQDEGSIVC